MAQTILFGVVHISSVSWIDRVKNHEQLKSYKYIYIYLLETKVIWLILKNNTLSKTHIILIYNFIKKNNYAWLRKHTRMENLLEISSHFDTRGFSFLFFFFLNTCNDARTFLNTCNDARTKQGIFKQTKVRRYDEFTKGK